MTSFNNYDILLCSDREAALCCLKNKARSRFEGLNRFSIANRTVPFLLENNMPRGIYIRTEEIKRKSSKARLGHPGWWKDKKLSEEIRRKMSESHKGKLRCNVNTEDLINFYQSGLSPKRISKIINASESTIFERLVYAGVKIRTIKESIQLSYRTGKTIPATGENHPCWKGGRRLTAKGYIKVYIYPNDPFSSMRTMDGVVLEHRLIMARHLNRPLKKWETVHHKNHIKSDNKLENLILLPKKVHDGITILELEIKQLKEENEILKKRLLDIGVKLQL